MRGNNARSRQEVLNIIRATVESSIGDYATVHDHHMGCTYCEEQCVWKEKVLSLGTFHDARRMQALCKWVKQYNYDLPHLAGAITAVAKPEKASSYFERLCILGYFLEKTELKEAIRQRQCRNTSESGGAEMAYGDMRDESFESVEQGSLETTPEVSDDVRRCDVRRSGF